MTQISEDKNFISPTRAVAKGKEEDLSSSPAQRSTPIEEGEEKLEFLKREEITTMQKDIAKLREIEAQKERERVSGFKIGKIGETKAIKEERVEEKEIERKRKIAQEEERKKQEKLLAEKKAVAQAPTQKFGDEGQAEAESPGKEEKESEQEERIKIAKEKETAAQIEKIEAEVKGRKIVEEEERKRKGEKILAEKDEEQKLAEIDKEIGNIGLEKEGINKEKERLSTEIKNFEIQLGPILKEEKIAENKILEIEELEKTTPLEKRVQVEKKRWETDAKRRDIEKRKWLIHEEIEKIEEKIETIELKYQEVSREEERFRAEKEKIFQRKREKELSQEKSRLKNEIFQLIDEKKIIENKENELLAKKNRIETDLKELLKEEQITEEVIGEIEKKEKEISEPREQRKIEKDRWKIEDDRKTLERKRWELEQEEKELSAELEEIEKEKQEIFKKENPLRERLKEIDHLLKTSTGEEFLEEETIIGLEKREVTQVPKPKFDGAEQEQVEAEGAKKKEERGKIVEEEIKKRVAEEEERKKQEKLLEERARFLEENQIKITEEKPSFENSGIRKESPGILIPEPPKGSSPFQKVLVRIAAVLILSLFVGFFYWFFEIRQIENPPEEKITPGEEIIPPEEETPEKAEIIIPLSLISVNATETLEISSLEEASTSLSQFLKKESATGNFTRILIKDSKENKILGLKEFFEAFKIRVPENFYQKIGEDFNLFVYSQEEGKRIGFITKIKEGEGLEELLKSWEPTMETDFGNLFTIMNKQGKALSPYFKNASYQGIPFRYQTFSVPHFGICYSISRAIAKGEEESSFSSPSNQYFIFTSSGKSMMKIIEQLTQE